LQDVAGVAWLVAMLPGSSDIMVLLASMLAGRAGEVMLMPFCQCHNDVMIKFHYSGLYWQLSSFIVTSKFFLCGDVTFIFTFGLDYRTSRLRPSISAVMLPLIIQ